MVCQATPILTLSFSDAGPNNIVKYTTQEEESRSISNWRLVLRVDFRLAGCEDLVSICWNQLVHLFAQLVDESLV